jgi:tail assembly chaperone
VTVWTWTCLLDGASGEAATHEDANAAAQAHNAQAGHESPSISYGHDDPPPDPMPQQWGEAERVRNAQLADTDGAIPPYVGDMPADRQQDFDTYQAEWRDFRQQLRDLPQTYGYPDGDPTAIVWPYLPVAPKIAITPPPSFVEWSHWHSNWTPK